MADPMTHEQESALEKPDLPNKPDITPLFPEIRNLLIKTPDEIGDYGHQGLTALSDITRYLRGIEDEEYIDWLYQKLGFTDKDLTTHRQMVEGLSLINEDLKGKGLEPVSFKEGFNEDGTPYGLNQLERLRREGARVVVNWMTGGREDVDGHYSIFEGLILINGVEHVMINDSEWTESIRFIRRDLFEDSWFDKFGDEKVSRWSLIVSDEEMSDPPTTPLDDLLDMSSYFPDYRVIEKRRDAGFCGPACLHDIATYLLINGEQYSQEFFLNALDLDIYKLIHDPVYGTGHQQLIDGLKSIIFDEKTNQLIPAEEILKMSREERAKYKNALNVEETVGLSLDELDQRRHEGARILVNWMTGPHDKEDGHYSIFEGFVYLNGIEFVVINDPEWVGSLRLIPRKNFEKKQYDYDEENDRLLYKWALIVTENE